MSEVKKEAKEAAARCNAELRKAESWIGISRETESLRLRILEDHFQSLLDKGEDKKEAAKVGFDFSPWIPPFQYDDMGSCIVDSKSHKILDIRGWGFLTGRGSEALRLSDQRGTEIQDKLGKFIASMMNAYVPEMNP